MMIKSYSSLSDLELAKLIKKGNQEAFTELYDRYKEILHRYAYRWLQDRETVKDVIQELFTVVWTNRENLIYNQNLSGYLYTSVRNAILRKISQEKRSQEYTSSLQGYLDKGESVTDHLLRENQLKAIIEKEISELPDKMREVFEMSRNNHMSHAEIALELGISEHTVRTHIKRALKVLREKLGILIFIYILIH